MIARSELIFMLPLPHSGAESFYDAQGIAQWIMSRYPTTRTVFLKHRANQGAGGGGGQQGGAQGAGEERGRVLRGAAPAAGEPVRFLENGVAFQADIVQGQKTGGCVSSCVPVRHGLCIAKAESDIVQGQKTGGCLPACVPGAERRRSTGKRSSSSQRT